MHAPADLRPILERFRPAELSRPTGPPTVHRGFSGATVYHIATSGGEFALRDWGTNGLPPRRLRGLHRLLDWIRRDGVRTVAVPLTADNDATFVLHNENLWQLEPWLPGVADFHADPSRDRLQNVMRALADWHRAARRFEAAEDEREWFRTDPADVSPAARERLQRILMWQRGRLLRLQHALVSGDRRAEVGGRKECPEDGDLRPPTSGLQPPVLRRFGEFVIDGFKTAAPAIAAALQKATEWRMELQPCLRDVWHDHVLFSRDEVTGLIDASACRCENVVSDLSRVLGSLVPDDRSAWEFAVECYSQHRDLRPAELRLLPILDRSSVLLSGLTWLDRYYLQRRRFPDPESVVRRMGRIAARLSHLTGRPLPFQPQ